MFNIWVPNSLQAKCESVQTSSSSHQWYASQSAGPCQLFEKVLSQLKVVCLFGRNARAVEHTRWSNCSSLRSAVGHCLRSTENVASEICFLILPTFYKHISILHLVWPLCHRLQLAKYFAYIRTSTHRIELHPVTFIIRIIWIFMRIVRLNHCVCVQLSAAYFRSSR